MAVYFCATSFICAKRLTTRIIKQFGIEKCLPYFSAFEQQRLTLDLTCQYIEQLIEESISQAGWQLSEIRNIPIFLGSTGYVIADCEARFLAKQPLPVHYSLAVIAEYLQQKYQTQVFSLATSCTSSAQGIYYAYKMLQHNQHKKALVIGFESFNQMTFEHFYAMGLLAEKYQCQPLQTSNGIILGEGIACIALSSQPHQDFRCEIFAPYSLTDNQNLTNNSENALKQLLHKICLFGKILPEQLQTIKIHGVGGVADKMEQTVLSSLFPTTPLLLLKPMIGHTLGASGSLESSILLRALCQQQEITMQKNCQELTALTSSLSNGYYLNYFLGFGGNNVGWLINWEK